MQLKSIISCLIAVKSFQFSAITDTAIPTHIQPVCLFCMFMPLNVCQMRNFQTWLLCALCSCKFVLRSKLSQFGQKSTIQLPHTCLMIYSLQSGCRSPSSAQCCVSDTYLACSRYLGKGCTSRLAMQ